MVMLIEVKSQQSQNSEPKGARRFEFKTVEKLSRLPAYFALMVVGIAAYLRSLSPAQASTPEPAGRSNGEPEGRAAPREQMMAQFVDLEAHGVDQAETGSIGDGGGRRGLGVEAGNPWPASFVVPEFPQFHFVAPRFQSSGALAFSPAALMDFPGNDNFGRQSGVSVVPIGPDESDAFPDNDNDSQDVSGNDPEGDDDNDGGGTGPGNRAPVVMGPVRLNDVFAGQMVLIGLVHLLRGAFDPDGDALSIEDVEVNGAELVATSEGWLLQTRPGMVGPVLISYRITDSEAWTGQEAVLQILRKVMVLGDDNDLIVGSPYDDDIFGGGGHDLIDALSGNDHVEGGDGNDHINGGEGDDVLVGDLGDDVIFGGNGNDLIFGGAGDDRLFGDDGDDTIFGEEGNDYLTGDAGNDRLDGGDGNDVLHGEDGDDRLFGGAGDDVLKGGAGNDVLEGGTGDNVLEGEDGNDVLIDGVGDDVLEGGAGDDTLVAGAGDDIMDGGDDFDTLDYSADEQDLVIDVVGGTSYSDELGTDTLANVEAVVGGAGNDMFIVGGKATVLSGGRGRDLFVFEVTDSNPGLSEDVLHKILDFVVGDRVRVRDYDLDRASRDAEKNMFEAIYGDDDDDWLQSDVPLQVSHELIDDEDWTIIVADLDGDNVYDLAVNIQGVMLLPPDNLA
jgi:Ca2+-binding RTX toxin-like protein